MGIFKDELDTKRVIFNINMDIAERLEKAKQDARKLGKKLDVDGPVNKAVEKFLKKAEKKIAEMQDGKRGKQKRLNQKSLKEKLENISDNNKDYIDKNNDVKSDSLDNDSCKE